MRSLKIALSVFVLFLAASASVYAKRGDHCEPEYTAPDSCFYVVNYGTPQESKIRPAESPYNCIKKGRSKYPGCADGDGSSKNPPPSHCGQNSPTDYYGVTEYENMSVGGKKSNFDNSLKRVCDILDIENCTGTIKDTNGVAYLQEVIRGESSKYPWVNKLCEGTGNKDGCYPPEATDPRNGLKVPCKGSFARDGKYGVCTRAAVQNFMEKYLASDDCDPIEIEVYGIFDGEPTRSGYSFASPAPVYKQDCKDVDEKGVCTSSTLKVKIKKGEKAVFTSDCGENSYSITEEDKGKTVPLNFNCKEPTKTVECTFIGVDGKTYKCFDKEKGEECEGEKNCEKTLKGPKGTKFEFESDCGTDTYEVVIGEEPDPQTLTFDCSPAPCDTGRKFDSGCLFPTWNDPGAEVIQGVIGENYDYKFGMGYIPRIINILLKFIAPVVVVMFIYTGVRFIMAGGDEDELNQSKEFFTYASIGLGFIVLSYSVMKALYFFITSG